MLSKDQNELGMQSSAEHEDRFSKQIFTESSKKEEKNTDTEKNEANRS